MPTGAYQTLVLLLLYRPIKISGVRGQRVSSLTRTCSGMSGIPGEGLNRLQVQLVAVTSTCLLLSTSAVAMRLIVRWSSAAMLWWDDWLAVLALV